MVRSEDNQHFRMVNRAQNMCLDAAGTAGEDGADVLFSKCDKDASDQLWSLSKPEADDDFEQFDDDDSTQNDYFWIVNMAQGMCLGMEESFTVGRGYNVKLTPCDWLNDDQRWRFSSEFFQIRNRMDNMCADVQIKHKGDKTSNKVVLWGCDDMRSQQKWHLIASKGGVYHLRNRMMGVCLSESAKTITNKKGQKFGMAMAGEKCAEQPNQLWNLDHGVVGKQGTYYRLRNSASDRCLDLVETMPHGGVKAITDWGDFYKNGTAIRVADCNEAYDQQWRLADHVSNGVHLARNEDMSFFGMVAGMFEEALLMTVFIAFIIFACNKGLCDILLRLWVMLYSKLTGAR
jgi:hypothetical protein